MSNRAARLFKPFISGMLATARYVLGIAAIAAMANTTQAVPLLDGYGGPEGFGELAMQKNDDDSSNQLDLPFAINFFGTTHNTFFINNNGNISFGDSRSTYTPNAFPNLGSPMIAPFWGDVDTRCAQCGNVYVASPNAETVVVTWHNVGYYNQQSNKINDFQLTLRDRGADFDAGDFDIEFRYDRLEWTTGNASGGTNGLGGTPAQAGFDSGDGVNFFTLPGSRTAAVLDLENNSNITGAPGGLWNFAIRQGGVPGSSAANPLMPVVSVAGWQFDFNVDLNQRIFIDPEIAIGYDYIVDSGPNFQTVLLPDDIGDGMYDLWLWDGLGYIFETTIQGGIAYDFGIGGVDRFRILGIEESAGLDPTDTSAFVTGLTFASAGQVSMRQIAISIDTDPIDPIATVPVPASLPIMLLGLAILGLVTRARTLAQRPQIG